MKAGTHSAFGEGSHTAAYTPKQEPSLPRPQHSLELPAKSSPKEQPEEADARLWRVSASSGVAAPLGCVILLLLSKLRLVRPALGAFYAHERCVVSLPSACSACCRTAGRPLVKRAHLSFSEVGWPSLVSAVQNVSRILQKQQQFTPNSPGPL